METTLNAASNPAMANKLLEDVNNIVAQEVMAPTIPEVVIPSLPETTVELPGGLYDPFEGNLMKTAEVRELTGSDEEAIVRISEPGKALLTILEKATVSVGGQPATKEMLGQLLAGDREMLLLAIRKATFGSEIVVEAVCDKCPEVQTFTIDLNTDVEIKELEDPINDRRFTMNLKAGVAKVSLPTGDVQAKIINAPNKNSAELDTLLLASCVSEIGDQPVLGDVRIKNLGIKDRRDILEEIAKRNPGPQLSEIKKACGKCGQEVQLPLTLAELFRS
jgi:hypothetical protein